LITYRAKGEDHSLNSQVPILQSAFEELGHKVNVLRFTDISDEEAVKATVHSAAADLGEGTVALTDYTTREFLPEHLGGRKSAGGMLDDTVDSAFYRAIGGTYRWKSKTGDGEKNTDDFNKSFGTIVNKVKEKNGVPDKVYVVMEKIADHAPFYGGDLSKAFPILEKALMDAGIPKENIKQIDSNRGLRDKLSESKERQWVVIDRHNHRVEGGYSPEPYKSAGATTILLPTATQYQHMKEDFKVSDTQLKETMKENIAERFFQELEKSIEEDCIWAERQAKGMN